MLLLAFMVSTCLAAERRPASMPLWAGTAETLARSSASAADLCVISGDLDWLRQDQKTAGQSWLLRLNPASWPVSRLSGKSLAAAPVIASASGMRFDTHAPGWAAFFVKEVITPQLRQGADGWVLEGLSELPETASKALLAELQREHPSKRLFVATTDKTLSTAPASTGLFVEMPADALPAIKTQLQSFASAGRTVLVCAHASVADPASTHQQLAADLSAIGAVPFVTAKGGSGLSLAPLRERSRRVLVLYGWDTNETGKPAMLPADTMTTELLQVPLELMGYEADYAPVTQALPLDPEGTWAAVIVDGETHVPGAKETDVAHWLVKAKTAGLPVLFTGCLPFSREDALEIVAAGFGLRGSLALVEGARELTLTTLKPGITGTEAKVTARADAMRDLQAPEKADVLIAVHARDRNGLPVRWTPAFLCSWGGMWMDPYVIERASQDNCLFLADPYQILSAVLSPRGVMPAPDTTTRDGRRLFYSHIDGDGFASLSAFKGHPFCAEMVRDRILKVFPFPVTVSVVESDIRAWSEGLDDRWEPKLREVARSIYALPNIQAASHSFSHPYCWDRKDPNPGVYTEPNLKLKPAAAYPDIVLEREIRGSVDFINNELLPTGGKVGLFLWSGNCRPGAEALRLLRHLGLENMNGGDTIVSRLYPGMAGVAPRVTPWEGELQINAANQNEFMYANGWTGPFYGGFAKVMDTFERTETPRRLKPVNVYYHFYSAMNLSSLRALEKIHQWCEQRPLHAVTALEFASMTRDAWRTRVYELGPRRWLVASDGRSRTLRLPASAGRPDMEHCTGVTGWSEHGGDVFIHTNGEPRVELALAEATESTTPPDQRSSWLRLHESSAETAFTRLERAEAEFTAVSHAASEIEFAGLPAGTACSVTINDAAAARLSADERGHVRFTIPAQVKVRLQASLSSYADAR